MELMPTLILTAAQGMDLRRSSATRAKPHIGTNCRLGGNVIFTTGYAWRRFLQRR